MVTVESFVEQFLNKNGYLMQPSKVIAAENYPNLATYFYRSLPGNPNQPKGQNPFFYNVIDALGIQRGKTELDTLLEFLNLGYRLIDCYDMNKNAYPAIDILNDLTTLNAQTVLFITKNNKNTILSISRHEQINGIVNGISSKIVNDLVRGEVWHIFPNPKYPKHVRAFHASVNLAQQLGQF